MIYVTDLESENQVSSLRESPVVKVKVKVKVRSVVENKTNETKINTNAAKNNIVKANAAKTNAAKTNATKTNAANMVAENPSTTKASANQCRPLNDFPKWFSPIS